MVAQKRADLKDIKKIIITGHCNPVLYELEPGHVTMD